MCAFNHVSWRQTATAEARAAKRELDRTIVTAADLTGLLASCGGDVRLMIGCMALAADRLQDPIHRDAARTRFETFTATIQREPASIADRQFAGSSFTESRDVAHDDPELPAASSSEETGRTVRPGPPYRLAQVTRPGGGVAIQDLLHTPELDACLVAIVEQEGWLHADTVVERVCGAFEQSKVTAEAREGIAADLKRLSETGRLESEAEFYASPDTAVRPRDRSACAPALRSPRRIPPAEIRAAIEERLRSGPATRSAIAIDTAAMLGLHLATARLSSTLLGQAVTQALRDLDGLGRIRVAEDGSLALAELGKRDEAARSPVSDVAGALSDTTSSTAPQDGSDAQTVKPGDVLGAADSADPDADRASPDSQLSEVPPAAPDPEGPSDPEASSGL